MGAVPFAVYEVFQHCAGALMSSSGGDGWGGYPIATRARRSGRGGDSTLSSLASLIYGIHVLKDIFKDVLIDWQPRKCPDRTTLIDLLLFLEVLSAGLESQPAGPAVIPFRQRMCAAVRIGRWRPWGPGFVSPWGHVCAQKKSAPSRVRNPNLPGWRPGAVPNQIS